MPSTTEPVINVMWLFPFFTYSPGTILNC